MADLPLVREHGVFDGPAVVCDAGQKVSVDRVHKCDSLLPVTADMSKPTSNDQTKPRWTAKMSRLILGPSRLSKWSRRNRFREELCFDWRADALESRLLFDGDPVVVDPLVVAGDAPPPIVGEPAPFIMAAANPAASTITFAGLPDPDASIQISEISQPTGVDDVGRDSDFSVSVAAGETIYEIEVAANVRGRLVASFDGDVVNGRFELRDQNDGLLLSADASDDATSVLDRHLSNDELTNGGVPIVYRLHVHHESALPVDVQVEFTPAIAPVMPLGGDRVGVGEFQTNARPVSIQSGNFFIDSNEPNAPDPQDNDIAILLTDEEGSASLVIGSSLNDGSFSPRRILSLDSSLNSQPLEFRAADFDGDGLDEIALLYADRIAVVSIDGNELKSIDGQNLNTLQVPATDGSEKDTLSLRNLDTADVNGDGREDLGFVSGRQAFVITNVLGTHSAFSPFTADLTTGIKDGFIAIGLGSGEAFVVRSIQLADGTHSSRLERAVWENNRFADETISIDGSLNFYSSGVSDPARSARIDLLDLDDVENTRHVVMHDRYSADVWTITETGSSLTPADIVLKERTISAGKFIDATGNGLDDLITEQAALALNLRQTPTNPDELEFAYVFSADLTDRDSLTAFEPGQFNTDSRVDLIYGSKRTLGGYAVRIALGTTLNSYQLQQTASGLTPLTSTASGDFNGDGLDDFVSVTSGGATAYFVGLGNGTFLDPVPIEALTSGNGFAVGVIAEDFNGDGRTDLAMLRSFDRELQTDRYQLLVLLGTGNGTFTELIVPVDVAGIGFTPNALQLQAIDWNQDSVTDFAVLHGTDLTSTEYAVSIFDGASAIQGQSTRLTTWDSGQFGSFNFTTNAVLTAKDEVMPNGDSVPSLAFSIQYSVLGDDREFAPFLAVLRPASATNPSIAATTWDPATMDTIRDLDWVIGEPATNSSPGLVLTYEDRVEVYREQASGWELEEVVDFARRDAQDSQPFDFVDTVVVALDGGGNRIMTADQNANVVRFGTTLEDVNLQYGFARNSAVEVNHLLVGDFISTAESPDRQGSFSVLFGGLASGFDVVGGLGIGQTPVASQQAATAESQPIRVDLDSDGIADNVTLDANQRLFYQRGSGDDTKVNQRIEIADSILSFVLQTVNEGGQSIKRLVAIQSAGSEQRLVSLQNINDQWESTPIDLPGSPNSLRIASDGETVFVINAQADAPRLIAVGSSGAVVELALDADVSLQAFDTTFVATTDRLLIGNQRTGLVQVLGHDGQLLQKFSGSDQAQGTVSFGGEMEMIVGDIDADGRDDLISLNRGTRDITIRLGNADGRFGGVSEVIHLPHSPYSIAAADVDNDGDLDLLVTLDDQRDFTEDILNPIGVEDRVKAFEDRDEQLLVLFNDLDRNSDDPEDRFDFVGGSVSLGFQDPPNRITVIDVNGDEYPDLLLSNSNADAIVRIGQQIQAPGDKPFREPDPVLNSGVGDGRVELDVTSIDGRTDPVAITSSDQMGRITLQDQRDSDNELEQFDSYGGLRPEGVRFVDVNGDEIADAVYTNVNSNELIVQLGAFNDRSDPDSYFLDKEIRFAVGSNPTDFAILDPSNGTDPAEIIIAVYNKGSNDVSIIYPGNSTNPLGPRLSLDAATQNAFDDLPTGLNQLPADYEISVAGIDFSSDAVDANLVIQFQDNLGDQLGGTVLNRAGFGVLDNLGNGFFNDQNSGGFVSPGPIIDSAFINGDIYALLGDRSIQRFDANSGRGENIARLSNDANRLLTFRQANTDFLAVSNASSIEFLNLDGSGAPVASLDLPDLTGGLNDFVYHEPTNLLYLVDSGETVTVFELDFVSQSLDLSGLLAQLDDQDATVEVPATVATIGDGPTTDVSTPEDALTLILTRLKGDDGFAIDSEESLSELADAFFKTMVSLVQDSTELVEGWRDAWHEWQADTFSEDVIDWLEWTMPVGAELANPIVLHVSQVFNLTDAIISSLDVGLAADEEATVDGDESASQWTFDAVIIWWQENFEKVWKTED